MIKTEHTKKSINTKKYFYIYKKSDTLLKEIVLAHNLVDDSYSKVVYDGYENIQEESKLSKQEYDDLIKEIEKDTNFINMDIKLSEKYFE